MAILGIHGPNTPLGQTPRVGGGAPDPVHLGWILGHFNRVKLLSETHSPGEALWCKQHGMDVLLRVPGGAIVHWEDVNRAVDQYSGAVRTIEVGNEPTPTAGQSWADMLWTHASYLELVAEHSLSYAHQRGIRLCTPGWIAGSHPPLLPSAFPDGGLVPLDLSRRVGDVYRQFDLVGVHCYGEWVLEDPEVQRVSAWGAWAAKPVLITEMGLAGRWPLGTRDTAKNDREKFNRMLVFTRNLDHQVEAAYIFLAGGTPEWYAFTDPSLGFDPGGLNSYVLSEAAYTGGVLV